MRKHLRIFMDFIRELGTLALGSRIRNLGDSLMKDMVIVYREHGVDFEPRWFTIFQLLLRMGETSVTQIARELNQSHPAAVQVINMLEKKKLIISKKDIDDNRKRLISLSSKGKQLAKQLEPLWEIVDATASEILNESAPDLINKITEVEEALKYKSTYQRINEKIIQSAINKAEFVEFNNKYLVDFQQLNEHWLNSYLELTDHDIKVLSEPYKEVINKDGYISLLISGEKVIGTYALQKINSKVCELSKFTIKKEYRGWKLGERMLLHAIEKANQLKCESIVLFTHSKLKEATQLYRKTGFEFITEHPNLKDKTGRESLCLQLMLSRYNQLTQSKIQ